MHLADAFIQSDLLCIQAYSSNELKKNSCLDCLGYDDMFFF